MRIWQIDDDYPDSLIAEFNRDTGFDRFMLKRGQRIEPNVHSLSFRVQATLDELRAIDDIANSTMVPLISSRLATVLEENLGDAIQLILVTIKATDGVENNRQLVNVLTTAKVIDHSASRYTTVAGTTSILRFSKMVFRCDPLNNADIARSEEYPALLLVSERLADIMTDLRLTGLQLQTAETLPPNPSANKPMNPSGGSAVS